MNKIDVYIPEFAENKLRYDCHKKRLSDIRKNTDFAIELCLLFLSFFHNTYFYKNRIYETTSQSKKDGWKKLNSKKLKNTFGSEYSKIIEFLESIGIIEIDKSYKPENYSKEYRLTKRYLSKPFVGYKFKTKFAISMQNKHNAEKTDKAKNNIIANNLMNLQDEITMPDKTDLEKLAIDLVNDGYKNKKNKILTFDYSGIDKSKFSTVEDSLMVYDYNYHNSKSFKIPTITFGGRVFDSINVLPTWIRNTIKIKNDSYFELDFSCLHPNIANSIYGKNESVITHEQVATDTGKDIISVKLQHLSFFNKKSFSNITTEAEKHKTMENSFLFDYYYKKYPDMINNILDSKKTDGYKAVTEKIFKTESQLMTAIIEKLNAMGIYVGYIFDALYCAKSDAEIVKMAMNETAKDFGIKTFAK